MISVQAVNRKTRQQVSPGLSNTRLWADTWFPTGKGWKESLPNMQASFLLSQQQNWKELPVLEPFKTLTACGKTFVDRKQCAGKLLSTGWQNTHCIKGLVCKSLLLGGWRCSVSKAGVSGMGDPTNGGDVSLEHSGCWRLSVHWAAFGYLFSCAYLMNSSGKDS